MVWDSTNVQTRQFERRETQLPARIEIHPEHAAQIRFGFGDVYNRFTIVDVSEGGMGLRAGVLLPKNTRMVVRTTLPGGGDFSILAVVRRCIMTDVKPTYLIGLQFLDVEALDPKRLAELTRSMQTPAAANADPAPGKGDHAG